MKLCERGEFDSLTPLPDTVTVCATVSESGDEEVITELMIRRACEQMDADQLWPFASLALDRRARQVPEGGASILTFPGC